MAGVLQVIPRADWFSNAFMLWFAWTSQRSGFNLTNTTISIRKIFVSQGQVQTQARYCKQRKEKRLGCLTSRYLDENTWELDVAYLGLVRLVEAVMVKHLTGERGMEKQHMNALLSKDGIRIWLQLFVLMSLAHLSSCLRPPASRCFIFFLHSRMHMGNAESLWCIVVALKEELYERCQTFDIRAIMWTSDSGQVNLLVSVYLLSAEHMDMTRFHTFVPKLYASCRLQCIDMDEPHLMEMRSNFGGSLKHMHHTIQ